MNITHCVLLRHLPIVGDSREFINAMTFKKRVMELVKVEYRDVDFGRLASGRSVTETFHVAVMKELATGKTEPWEIVRE